MTFDLRERAHEVMRAELAEAAFTLVVERGYEGLTADDLARGLGVSRPTFYRYLGSKDDVVVSVMLGPDDTFARALTASAGGPDEASSWWQLLRAAFGTVVAQAEESPARMRARIRLIQDQPAVGAKLRRARGPQIDALAEALAGQGASASSARVLAVAAVGVHDQCLASWARDDDASLRELLDQAFADLDAASSPPSRSAR